MSPDDPLNCLLVQPAFSANNYWNYTAVATSLGARTVAPPLGLLTVAALLPRCWSVTLVDLNVRPITDAEWNASDMVCVGGMLPQQPGILEIVSRANADGKYVAVGGADPTSQPELYDRADAVVVGEGEASIPLWLDAWRRGQPRGRFESVERPDVSTSPTPRFDLLDFSDYVHVGVQSSRGCPFNCEFCDIIELYGRVPRYKTTSQVLAELDALYGLGYRGWIDIVDDNFIGNSRSVKSMLRELKTWSAARDYPFFFSTEATMNLADDDELLDLMQAVDFRHVFMGIETPEPELLALTQKPVNAMKPVSSRVGRIYEHGISVTAGFIIGFDDERPGSGQAIAAAIKETGIVIAMVGLLVALPNTQLARRLQRERRLLGPDLRLVEQEDEPYRIATTGTHGENEDNQSAGLNFVTTRDRVEVYAEYQAVLKAIYSPRNFMNRVLATATRLNAKYRHRPNLWETKRNLRALLTMMVWMTKNGAVRRYYWRNTLRTLVMGANKFDYAQSLMLTYMHFENQARRTIRELDTNIDFATNHASYPRVLERTTAGASPEPDSPSLDTDLQAAG